MDSAQHARELHRAGAIAAAETRYMAAIAEHPMDHTLLHDLGVLLMQSHRPKAAINYFRRIPDGTGTHLAALLPLALCERSCGLYEDALRTSALAINSHARDPLAWLLYGSLLVICGNLRAGETSLRKCLQLAPQFAEAHHFLGESLQRQGRAREALAAYAAASRQQPMEAFNIAQCAEVIGDTTTAARSYEQTIALAPHRADVWARYAHFAAAQCDFPTRKKAVACLEELLSRDLAGDDYPEPFALAHLPVSAAAYRKALTHYAGRIASTQANAKPPRPAGHRLRIAYLSCDFGGHAVGHLVRHLFRSHDHEKFEIYGYSLKHAPCAVEKEMALDFTRYSNISDCSDTEAAAVIERDRIDVLIDLGGYTLGARPAILGRRPARIQLGWLGFISPHEAPWLDGLLMDNVVCPDAADWLFSDRIVRLATPLLPASPPTSMVSSSRKTFGLPEHGPLFASFNNTYKLSGDLIDAWVAILGQCRTASIAVYAPAPARDGFMTQWTASGGDAAQVLFMDNIDRASNLQRMACCDLLLDAFDYHAGATAIDAIDAGLPILCKPGQMPVSRMSASLNDFLGMPELICGSIQDYIEKAIALAINPGNLRALREQLLASPRRRDLLDPRRSARDIEHVCSDFISRLAITQ